MRYVYVTYEVKPGCAKNLVKAFLENAALQNIRLEEGCHMYDYFLPAEERDVVVLHEVWESPKAHEAHLAGSNMAPLGEIKKQYVLATKLDVVDKEEL